MFTEIIQKYSEIRAQIIAKLSKILTLLEYENSMFGYIEIDQITNIEIVRSFVNVSYINAIYDYNTESNSYDTTVFNIPLQYFLMTDAELDSEIIKLRAEKERQKSIENENKKQRLRNQKIERIKILEETLKIETEELKNLEKSLKIETEELKNLENS